jgi:hypothetical protein
VCHRRRTGKPARGSGTLGGRPTIAEEILELQVALSGGVDESVSVAVEQEPLTLRAHRHERLVQIPAVPPRNQIISCAMTDLEWWGVLADTVNRARHTSDVRDLSRRAAQEPLYHRVAAGDSPDRCKGLGHVGQTVRVGHRTYVRRRLPGRRLLEIEQQVAARVLGDDDVRTHRALEAGFQVCRSAGVVSHG